MRTDREQAVRRLVWAGTQRVQPVGGDHAEASRVIWGTLEEEGRQLGQGKRVRTLRPEREHCYSPFLRQPLSRRQPFPGCADPWGTVSRNLCLLVFLNSKNQGSDQDPTAL